MLGVELKLSYDDKMKKKDKNETDHVALREFYINVRAYNAVLKCPKLKSFLANARKGMSTNLRDSIDVQINILDTGN